MIKRLKQKGYHALKKSEKYTKTDMIYLTKGGFWLSLGKGVGILSGLALSVAFANLLPPDVYGNYRFILSIAAIVSAFTLTGMGTAIVQAVARGYEGALRTGFTTHLKWSVGIALASLAVSGYYFINDNYTLAISMLVVGAFSPFLESFSLYGPFLTGKKEFRLNTIYTLIRRSIPLILLLCVLFITDNVIIIILTFFASHTLTTGILYVFTLKKFNPKSNFETNTTTYSKHLSVMNVVARIANNLDNILIFHFLGAAQVAIYSFALIIPQKLRDGSQILQVLSLPKLSNRTIPELRRSLPRKVVILFVPTIFAVILYIVTAPYVFELFFPQYIESVLYSQLFSLSLIFLPGAIFVQALTAHMKTQELYILKVVMAITKILLLCILLPIYGVWGAINSLLIAHGIGFCLSIFLFWNNRNYKKPTI